jgi:hypothetical protein
MSTPAKSAERRQPRASGKVRLSSFDQLDLRFGAAQAAMRFRDDLASDLGGLDRLTAGERALVDHAAILNAILAHLGVRYLHGHEIDMPSYMGTGNAMRRVLETLGLQRRSRDVTPTLEEIVARHDAAKAAA